MESIQYFDTSFKVFEHDRIFLLNEDCNEGLKKIKDKSIQLICIDPPYNIGKDTWDKIENYMEWLMNIIVILETKLKDNGSLFIFHNDMETIAELMTCIKTQTKLKFRQMIVWNKRFDGSNRKGYLDGYVVKNDLHNWNKMAEYILFFTFDNHEKLLQKRRELNLYQLEISKHIKSKTGGLTGWYSNIESGKNLPTRQTIIPIQEKLGITYDDLVPKFNNLKTHHSVWNYDMAKRIKHKLHITPKPTDLLENIILHTTDENDIVLDCFAGTGSIGQACLNTKRQCIMMEVNSVYTEYISSQFGK